MATLTLKQVPEELYQRLKEQATAHRRSINNEAIVCLESMLQSRPVDFKTWLEQARDLRRQTPESFLTDETLRTARDSGRP